MNKNILLTAIIGALGLVVFLSTKYHRDVLSLSFDPKNMAICNAKARALKEGFRGIVIDKFNDSINHNYETIKMRNLDSVFCSNIFVLDNSDAFQIIEIGDSIIKKYNDLSLIVFKKSNKITFELEFDCEK